MVLLALVALLACSVIILSVLHTASINRHIVYLDLSSLQAWQAADAGLAWAECQLSQKPFNHSEPLQIDLILANGASCLVTANCTAVGPVREYTVNSAGSYRGATYHASRKIVVLPPLEGD